MLIKRAFLLIILGLSLVTLHPAHGQSSDSAPLIVLMGGDFWKYADSTWTQMTQSGYHQTPLLAPDGTQIAYRTVAPDAIAAIESGQGTSGLPATNINLLNLATGEEQSIATQPDNISLAEGRYILRSEPSWSPDSTQIAWTDLAYPSGTDSLVVYDVATVTPISFPLTLPQRYGIQGAAEIRWGAAGIAIWVTGLDVATGGINEIFSIYAPDGQLLSTSQLPFSETSGYILDFFWIEHQGNQDLGVLYSNGDFYLIDPRLNTFMQYLNPPTFFASGTAGAPSISLVRAPENQIGLPFSFSYQPDASGTAVSIPETLSPLTITIAPDGTALAYITSEGQVVVVQNGSPQTITSADQFATALVWANKSWMTAESGGAGGGAG
ncbi:MAG: hypothetical protein BroJett018_17320 [Chloroflexota bacterium]|nr:hypothetical protein [Chloroflexota bacterium]NOG63828.1 hypothetical protein [Chloroflexota bacterium]GIK63938.1 MAG: hypothetical protein BroJett018_17320 [Chloroflexota bacterium]